MYLCVCLCVCVLTWVCVHMCAHVCACMLVYASRLNCVCACACVFLCAHVCVCVCVCLCVCVWQAVLSVDSRQVISALIQSFHCVAFLVAALKTSSRGRMPRISPKNDVIKEGYGEPQKASKQLFSFTRTITLINSPLNNSAG